MPPPAEPRVGAGSLAIGTESFAGTETGRDEMADGAALTLEDLIDDEAIASCAAEADDRISLEAVRTATARIKDSMARVVIEDERAKRF